MILIRSAKIVDGAGKPPFTADVLINGDKISAIGYFPAQKADTVIDGLGCYLAPGFIDVDNDIGQSLAILDDAAVGKLISQGVTTVIGGGDGLSFNADGRLPEEFFQFLEKRKLAINFGALLGHSTVRSNLFGSQNTDLTGNELSVMANMLKKYLAEGALGFSTGLDYFYAKNISYKEIRFLAESVKNTGAVYMASLRNETRELENSVKEILSLAESTGMTTVINHFRPIIGYEDSFEKALELIVKTKANLFVSANPFTVSIIPIYKFLPDWAYDSSLEKMAERLLDGNLRNRLLKELPSLQKDSLVFASAPGNEFLVGKTIGASIKNQGLTPAETLLKLMAVTRLKASVFYKNINIDLMQKLLINPKSLIGSRSLLFPESAFLRFLELTGKYLSIEKAIQKITSAPARCFNIKKRGEIVVGNFADLVLLKKSVNSFRMDVKSVFLNGKIAVNEGIYQKSTLGKIIKKVYAPHFKNCRQN